MPTKVEINGRIVEFDQPPTPEDIDKAAAELSGPGWGTTIAAGAARIGAPIVGGMVGSVGGPWGAAAGAALGGAAGEEIGDWIEGKDDGYKDAALSAGLSALPAGPAARAVETVGTTAARRVGLHMLEGAAQGTLQGAVTAPVMEGRAPTAGEVAAGAAGGAVLGGAFGGGAELYSKARGVYRAGAEIVDDLAGADAAAQAHIAAKAAPVADDFGAEDALARELVGPPEPARPVLDYHAIREMDADALEAAAVAEREHERGAAARVFGPDVAARYEALQRTANSPFPSDRADAAARETEALEAGLSESQRADLFGIGQVGYNADELRGIARAARDYAPGNVEDVSTDDLLNTVGRELLERDPDVDPVSAVRLRGALRELGTRGESMDVISEAVRRRAIQQGIPPDDARVLLGSTLDRMSKPPEAPPSASTAAAPQGEAPQPQRAPETRPPAGIDPDTQEPVGPATDWGTPPRSPLRPYADGDATVPEAGPMSPERMDRAIETAHRVLPADVAAEVDDVYRQLGEERMRDAGGGVETVARREALATHVLVDPDIPIPPAAHTSVEEQAMSDVLRVTGADVVRLRELAAANPDDEVIGQALNRALGRMSNVAYGLTGSFSTAGRALQAAQTIIAHDTPAARIAAFAAKAAKMDIPRADIEEAMRRAGDDPIKQYEELLKFARRGHRLTSYYVLNLLTSPLTLSRNLIGNALRFAAVPVDRAVAGGVSAVKSAVTGRNRAVYAREATHYLAGAWAARADAMRAVVEIYKHGYSRSQAANQVLSGKFDVTPEPFSGGLKNPYNVISRTLEATDQFFRALSMSGERQALATTTALNEAKALVKRGDLTDADFDKWVVDRTATLKEKFTQAPPKSLLEEANRAVFREDNAWGGAVAHTDDLMGWGKPLRRVVLPFVRTPANIMRQGLEHSPLGIAKRGFYAGGRAGTLRQGEFVVGSTVAALVAQGVVQGTIVGTPPKDPEKREMFSAKYGNGNFIDIPGYGKIPFTELGPFGVSMGIVANAIQPYVDDGKEIDDYTASDIVEKSMQGAINAGTGMLDASYLSGAAEFIKAIQGGDYNDVGKAMTAWGQDRIRSLVPGQGALRAATYASDDVTRKPEGLAERIGMGLPDWSRPVANALGVPTAGQVKPRLDAFGLPVKRDRSGAAALSPVSPALERGDSTVRKELRKQDVFPGGMNKPIDEVTVGRDTKTTKKEKLPVDPGNSLIMNSAKGQLQHYRWRRLFETEAYKNATPEGKKKMISDQKAASTKYVKERAADGLRAKRNLTVRELLTGLVPEDSIVEIKRPDTQGPSMFSPSEAGASENIPPPPTPAAKDGKITKRGYDMLRNLEHEVDGFRKDGSRDYLKDRLRDNPDWDYLDLFRAYRDSIANNASPEYLDAIDERVQAIDDEFGAMGGDMYEETRAERDFTDTGAETAALNQAKAELREQLIGAGVPGDLVNHPMYRDRLEERVRALTGQGTTTTTTPTSTTTTTTRPGEGAAGKPITATQRGKVRYLSNL
jgi:hypothetical protein